MKNLYWKTRPLRLTPTGGRRIHWPGVALNLALALALVGLPLGGLVLADLGGNFAEFLTLTGALLPIVVTLGTALATLGFGFRVTAPVDCLPGENGEPPAQRTTRWFHWANLRAVLFGLLASITVLLLARTLSDWQGRRAWEAYRVEAEKRGVVFDLEKLMPPPVPDAENFAATPLLRPFQSGNSEFAQRRAKLGPQDSDTPFRVDDPQLKEPWPNKENWMVGQRWNLPALQAYYRSSTNFPAWPTPRTPAEDVLKALSRFEAEVAELRTAAARPQTRFNTQLTEDGVSTLLPHLSAVKSSVLMAALRSVAASAAGRTNEVFADAQLAFRLSDTLRNEPLLISHLVRIATHTIALRAMWEGLVDHRWTDAQLAHWQTELSRRDFASELRLALAGERVFGNRGIEYLRRRPEMLEAIGAEESGVPPAGPTGFRKWVWYIPPPSWSYGEQTSYNRFFDEYVVAALSGEPGKFDPSLIQAKQTAFDRLMERDRRTSVATLRHCALSQMLLPALSAAMHRACQAQAYSQLAATACALERHRLARGSYPESLATLSPEFGPALLDPVNGQPFHYERSADGRFRLWSVGWNGKDDGGVVVLAKQSNWNVDKDKSDWVWPVPPK